MFTLGIHLFIFRFRESYFDEIGKTIDDLGKLAIVCILSKNTYCKKINDTT